jgi:hypothetical protein
MNRMSELQPIESRRGLDPQFFGEEHGSWTAVQVLAPCEQVAAALAKTTGMKKLLGDAFDPAVRVPVKDSWKAIFIYQLRGHPWTLIQSNANLVYFGEAEHLSKKLATKVMVYSFQDTVDVGGYFLYDQGRDFEYYSWGGTPSFEDSNRQENLAAGWMLSSDNLRHLRSERLRNVDLDSPGIDDLPNRTAIDFDLYVPYDPWEVDGEGRIFLSPPWTPADFQRALVILAK